MLYGLDWFNFLGCLLVIALMVFAIFIILGINRLILDTINEKRKNKITVWQYLINVALIILFGFAIFCGVKYLKSTAVRHPDVHYHYTTHNYNEDCDGSITCDNNITTINEIDTDLTNDWVVKFEDGPVEIPIELDCDDVKECVKEALE